MGEGEETHARGAARERVRVLHIVLNLNYGGLERVVADLVSHTDRERFETHVLALEYLGHFAETLRPYAELHLADPMPRYSMLWPGPLVRQIRRIAPDVLHSHSGVWYKASLAARAARVRRIVHTDHGRHRPDPWHVRLLDGLASRRTDVTVAVSATVAHELATGVVWDPSRIRVLLNGVDTARFAPRPDTGHLRAELALDADVPILGSIGRLEPVKGYDLMIAAFERLRAGWGSGVPPVLVIGGDGSQRPLLEQRIRERGLERQVFLLGWRDDLHELHSALALFTMSSHSEGTSISLLEAMSAGLCPVVTDVGGNGVVLGDPLAHRLVPPGDADALAAAWRAALADPVRTREDAEVARTRVVESFSLAAMVTRYEEFYAGEGESEGARRSRRISRSRSAPLPSAGAAS